jgi:hypothetical protein
MRRRPTLVSRVLKRLLIALAAVLAALLAPVAYVEVACRGDAGADRYRPLIADPALQRREANTYLTYPEWHIVYAYDGLAELLRSGDEHRFAYLPSIARFWRSACALMEAADAHGGADWATRQMIHTIGVSFTAEMAVKAAYEETLGRLTAWLRGREKSPQDEVVARVAADYAAFLRQTPWYKYQFARANHELWAAPVTSVARGWERRLGIGLEFAVKAAYARVIARAVAATAPPTLVIRTIVSGLDEPILRTIPHVTVMGVRNGGIEIETPRYDLFTRVLAEIARRGGTVREIAGNDDIMVTLTVPEGFNGSMRAGTVIMHMPRDGLAGERLLVDVKVRDLASLIAAHPPGDPGLEHVFDY